MVLLCFVYFIVIVVGLRLAPVRGGGLVVLVIICDRLP